VNLGAIKPILNKYAVISPDKQNND